LLLPADACCVCSIEFPVLRAFGGKGRDIANIQLKNQLGKLRVLNVQSPGVSKDVITYVIVCLTSVDLLQPKPWTLSRLNSSTDTCVQICTTLLLLLLLLKTIM
jgi:hypothetical protein